MNYPLAAPWNGPLAPLAGPWNTFGRRPRRSNRAVLTKVSDQPALPAWTHRSGENVVVGKPFERERYFKHFRRLDLSTLLKTVVLVA